MRLYFPFLKNACFAFLYYSVLLTMIFCNNLLFLVTMRLNYCLNLLFIFRNHIYVILCNFLLFLVLVLHFFVKLVIMSCTISKSSDVEN